MFLHLHAAALALNTLNFHNIYHDPSGDLLPEIHISLQPSYKQVLEGFIVKTTFIF